MSTTTPNMGLTKSTVGSDSGLNWEINLNASLSTIDGHSHAPGFGVQINPAGLNINSDLPINNNNLINARTIRFQPQGSSLSGAADLDCLYVSGIDLYYNDGIGRQIPITAGGGVTGATGTITGLPSGTAGAAYNAGTFVFQSATNTSAVIDGQSFILRNNIANSNGLTLLPPNAMTSNYSITLPSYPYPSVQSIMALDHYGNMSAPYTVDNVTIDINGSNQFEVKVSGVGTSQIANAAVTPIKMGALNYQLSSGVGTSGFSTSSSTLVPVTGLSVTITTYGRPVMLQLIGTSTTLTPLVSQVGTSGNGLLAFMRASTAISISEFIGYSFPPSSFSFIDIISAGTYTYSVDLACVGGNANIGSCKLMAYEL